MILVILSFGNALGGQLLVELLGETSAKDEIGGAWLFDDGALLGFS